MNIYPKININIYVIKNVSLYDKYPLKVVQIFYIYIYFIIYIYIHTHTAVMRVHIDIHIYIFIYTYIVNTIILY